ncbi:MAG TPA: hypothetical protein VK943_02525, partial [Arenibaculum sp.]|nr:hypothetical protein [Arenibaculum sp.]
EVGVSCVIGSLVVRSGDWIFADRSGAVVIPDPLLDEVLEDAMRIEETEARILARIRDGASLVDLVDGAAGRI